MKENFLAKTTINDDFNIAGMYFLEHNFQKSKYVNENELLSYISSIIEAVTINSCINEIDYGSSKYLKTKNKEIMWLAAKSRFRAKSSFNP